MSWWQLLGAWGVQVEVEAAELDPPVPSGAQSMVVGVYVGLVLGTMHPEYAGEIRRELEAEMGGAMDVPAEQIESAMRELIAAKVGRR